LGVLAYVSQVVQEVGKALEGEVCVGGECLSGLDPEVIRVMLNAVSPVSVYGWLLGWRWWVVRWRKLICKVLQDVCAVTKGSC
jgi:hypothetical protein